MPAIYPKVRPENGDLVSFYKDDVRAVTAAAPLPVPGRLPEPLKVSSKVEIASNNPEVRLENGHVDSFYKDDVRAVAAAAPLPAGWLAGDFESRLRG